MADLDDIHRRRINNVAHEYSWDSAWPKEHTQMGFNLKYNKHIITYINIHLKTAYPHNANPNTWSVWEWSKLIGNKSLFKSNGAAMLFFRSKRRCSESRESEGVLPDGDVHGKETVAFGEK